MKTKTKLRLLTASIAITFVVLVAVFVYSWFNLTPETLSVLRFVTPILLAILIAQIVCWLRIDCAKSDALLDDSLAQCNELEVLQRAMIGQLAVSLRCFEGEDAEVCE